jgi:predicted dehydrogenase
LEIMIRQGIIGAGAAVQKLHWPVLQHMTDEIRVTAVASRTLERAELLAELIGQVKTYDDYRFEEGPHSRETGSSLLG